MKKITTTINASNKKLGMTGPELVKAVRSAREGDDVTVRVGWAGKIKSVTITKKTLEPVPACNGSSLS